eukprot:jgi/Mesvir1/5556/Mv25568-RA.1
MTVYVRWRLVPLFEWDEGGARRCTCASLHSLFPDIVAAEKQQLLDGWIEQVPKSVEDVRANNENLFDIMEQKLKEKRELQANKAVPLPLRSAGDQSVARATRALRLPIKQVISHVACPAREIQAQINRACAPAARGSTSTATPTLRTLISGRHTFKVNGSLIRRSDLLVVKRPAVTCGQGMPWAPHMLVKVLDLEGDRTERDSIVASPYYAPSWTGQFSRVTLGGGSAGMTVPISDVHLQHWTVGGTAEVHQPELISTGKLSAATVAALKEHPQIDFEHYKTATAARAAAKDDCNSYFAEHGARALIGMRLCALFPGIARKRERFHGWVTKVQERGGHLLIKAMWADGQYEDYHALAEVTQFVCGCPHPVEAFGRARFFPQELGWHRERR